VNWSVTIYPSPVYESSIYISEKSIDDPRAAQRAYAQYCFPLLQDAYIPGQDDMIRHTAASVFRSYFIASFSETPPPTGDSDLYKWIAVLWEIRAQHGKTQADQIVVFTLKAFNERRQLNPKWDFNESFYWSLMAGRSVIDNQISRKSVLERTITDAMLKYQLSRPSPAPTQ
jgi:hypothetical protein